MELVQLGSFLLGIFLGIRFWRMGADYLEKHFDKMPQLLPMMGFIFVFVVVLLAVRLVGRLIKFGMDQTLLGGFDQVLGALLGVLKWAFGIGAFIWCMQRYPIGSMLTFIKESKVCAMLIHCSFGLL